MNLSSISSASSVTSGFLSEPPVSPGPAPESGPTPFPQLRTVDSPPASEASPGSEPLLPLAPVAPATPPAPAAPAVFDVPAAEGAPPGPSDAPARPLESPSLESVLLRMRLVTPDQIASAMREEAETGRPIADIVVANGWVSADDLARLQSAAPSPLAVATPAPDPEPAQESAPAPAAAAPAPVSAPAPAPAPAPASAPAPVAAAAPAPEAVAVAAPEAATAEAPAPAEPTVPMPTPSAVEATAAPPPAARAGVGARVLVRLENGERIEVGHFGEFESAKQRARELSAELQRAAEWPFLSGRFVRPEAIVSVDIDLTGF